MKIVAKCSGVYIALALVSATIHDPAQGATIPVSSYQVGGFYGAYTPADDVPPSYPATIGPDNLPGLQNYFMGRTTTPMGFATPERRAFFIYDMAGVAASIPPGEAIVGVTIDLTLIPGGTSALANFTGGFEHVAFTSTAVPAPIILAPGAIPPTSIWATFGTGAPFGDFVIGDPGGPMPTPPATYTIGLEAFSESLAQEVKGFGIKVALVEPGIIDTAMATTNLSQYATNTDYAHGRRVHAFFTNPAKPPASPTLVGEMIRYVIEGNDPRLRFPVGPDALSLLGWRIALSDEDWVGLGGLKGDADYFERVFMDTGVDLRSP